MPHVSTNSAETSATAVTVGAQNAFLGDHTKIHHRVEPITVVKRYGICKSARPENLETTVSLRPGDINQPQRIAEWRRAIQAN